MYDEYINTRISPYAKDALEFTRHNQARQSSTIYWVKSYSKSHTLTSLNRGKINRRMY